MDAQQSWDLSIGLIMVTMVHGLVYGEDFHRKSPWIWTEESQI
jgi:hypothetical protein